MGYGTSYTPVADAIYGMDSDGLRNGHGRVTGRATYGSRIVYGTNLKADYERVYWRVAK